MSDQIRFAYPWVLGLLVLLPIVALLRGRRGAEAAVQYSALALLGTLGWQRQVRPGALLAAVRYLALACLIVALARPQKVSSSTQVQESGIDMMLAIDLSPSMEALDFKKGGQEVSRIEVARDTIAQFIRDRPNDRLGMVVFAGQAFLLSPPTLDHDWLLQNVSRLNVGLAGDATAIGSALAAAANHLRKQRDKSKVIVLMTDGQNNSGKVTPLAAAQAARALGIKIYTIGAGSADVAKFPRRDIFGRVYYEMLPVDIDEATLKKIAEIGNGRFFRAADTSSLERVYQEINRLETSTAAVKHYENYLEYFTAWATVGLLLLLLEVVLAHTVWRRLP